MKVKRGALVTFAALGGLGVMLLQMEAGECRGGPQLCGNSGLAVASMVPVATVAHETVSPQAPRPNAAMAAALAARAAAAERATAGHRHAHETNPARSAALRAAQARQAGLTGSVSPAARALYFTDAVSDR